MSTMTMGKSFLRQATKTLLLLNLINPGITSAEETPTWDLASSDMAKHFFASSQIAATFISTDPPRVEWTATTPVPTACGASVFAQSQEGDGLYYWRHFFSDAMDPSVPSVDHVVSMNLDEDALNHVVLVNVSSNASMVTNFNQEMNGTIAFRLFAFLPYGKGTLVSQMYAIEIPMYLEDNANAADVPLPIYEMDYTTWNDIGWETDTVENTLSGPTILAPPMLKDHYGASPLAFSRGPTFGGESSGTVSATLNDNSMIEFHLENGISQEDGGGNNVAAAFHYGIDPSIGDRGDSENLSVDAFYATDGVADNGKALHHGLVRAQELSNESYAMITPSSLTSANWEDPSVTIVVGAAWVDGQMNVQYSSERKTALSDLGYTSPTQPPNSTSVGGKDYTTKLCPTESITNLALLSEGATIQSVSSNYGTTPDTVSSTFGAEKVLDGLGNTAWSSAGDGDEAFISIQLPFPTNLEYVEFHTRTMGSSSQIFEYQVEVAGGDPSGNAIIASSCTLPDATQSYKCSLDHDLDGVSAKNVTVVTFRVVRSSGFNTGAMEIGVYGCSADEEPLPTTDKSIGTCTSHDECTAKARSRFPMQSSNGVELCQCYAASSIDPFEECEGESDATCRVAKCMNTCDEFEARCLLSPDSSDETKVCTLQPISESTSSPISTTTGATSSITTPSPSNNNEDTSSMTPASVTAQIATPATVAPMADESVGTCTSEDECTAKVRSRFPMQSSNGVELCQCYAASSIDPFEECEGESGATCRVAKCMNTCDELEARCLLLPDSSDDTKVSTLQPHSSTTQAPIATAKNTTTPAPITVEGLNSDNTQTGAEQIASAESAGMSLTVSHSILISLLVVCISAFTARSCL